MSVGATRTGGVSSAGVAVSYLGTGNAVSEAPSALPGIVARRGTAEASSGVVSCDVSDSQASDAATVTVMSGSSGVVTVAVSVSPDDLFVDDSGFYSSEYQSLWFGRWDNAPVVYESIYARLDAVPIPPAATVTEAYLMLSLDYVEGSQVNLPGYCAGS